MYAIRSYYDPGKQLAIGMDLATAIVDAQLEIPVGRQRFETPSQLLEQLGDRDRLGFRAQHARIQLGDVQQGAEQFFGRAQAAINALDQLTLLVV